MTRVICLLCRRFVDPDDALPFGVTDGDEPCNFVCDLCLDSAED